MVYWTLFTQGEWTFYLAALEEGLCYVGGPQQSLDDLIKWTQVHLPGRALVRAEHNLTRYVDQFVAYLQGKRQTFTFPTVLMGTPFQQAVWQALGHIPYGQTKTYTDIACHIGKPAAVRAVGAAIGANPILIAVPCHRVIGKNGKLTGYRGGLGMKNYLLQLEQKKTQTGAGHGPSTLGLGM